jgi:uncharacterized membrane protein
MLSVYRYQPVLNERVLAFAFSIAAMYLTSYLLWREQKTVSKIDESNPSYGTAFLVAADFFALWLVGAEVFSYKASSLQSGLPLLLLIVVAAVTTLHYLVWRRTLTDLDKIISAANALFYLGISLVLWSQYRVWMGFLYLVLASLYGTLSYFTLRKNKQDNFGQIVLGIAVAFLTLAAYAQFGNSVWTTVTWSLEFVILTWSAIRLKLPRLMDFSMIAFVLVGGRLLRYDTVVDVSTYQPIINERVLAFIVGIAATYSSAYLIRRAREGAEQWLPFTAVLLVAANLFTLWVISFEVWNYFGSRLIAASQTTSLALRNMQNLSLTALWAFYAMVLLAIGISKRWRLVRIWALGLLIIPIIKVFLYDVWALQTIYRIVAFVGLGILLIVGGYLYQRNSKAIRGFFAE